MKYWDVKYFGMVPLCLTHYTKKDADEIEVPATNDTTQTPADSQVDANVAESQQDENKAIAQNLMIQANLLQQDADAKRKEAYTYDPSLAPKTEAKPKVRVTKAKTSDAPKKRGRPKKSEA
jgi:hypothetical protein